MANRTMFTALVGLAWALGLTAVVAAHQPGTSGSAPKPRQDGGAMESMEDMMSLMQECRKSQQEAMHTIDRVMMMLEAARQSNDSSRMRAALDQAQQPLAAMKDRMAMCTNTMERMQAMHGGMGGRMQGMMRSGPGSPREWTPPSGRPQ